MPLFFAMKHNKMIKTLAATIGFVIIGWLSFMRPDWLLTFGVLLGACGYALGLFSVTSFGSILLGERFQRTSISVWFAKLIAMQALLLLFTIAIGVAFFAAGPEYTVDTVTIADFKAMVMHYSPWQWGPFPWSAMALWSVIIGYLTYVKKGEPYLYRVGLQILPKRLEPMLKTYIESSTMGATTMAISLLVSGVVLLFAYAFEFQLTLFHFSVSIMTVVLLSFIGPLASLSLGRRMFRWLAGGRKATFNRALLMMIAFLVPTLIAAAFVGDFLLTHRPQAQMSLICKQCGNYFANVPQETRLAALYWGWCLICTPLAGSYVASISQGRTIRELVFGLYLVPLLVAVAWFLFSQDSMTFPVIQLSKKQIPFLMFGLAILTTAGMLLAFKSIRDTQLFLAGYMKPSAQARRNRLWLKDASKTIGINLYHPKILMTIIGSLFLHTMAGWYGMQLQAAAMGALIVNALYIGFNFAVVQVWRDHR